MSKSELIREQFDAWWNTFQSDNDRKPRAIEVWQACAELKEAEIATLRQQVEMLREALRDILHMPNGGSWLTITENANKALAATTQKERT